jgi:hypothetical protein
MWVRTTDRDVIVNFDNVQKVYIRDVEDDLEFVNGKLGMEMETANIVAYEDLLGEVWILGVYDTSAQAAEALDALQSALVYEHSFYTMPIWGGEGEVDNEA